MDKLIYRFNNQGTQSSFYSRKILGGKGANLAQMAKLGLPVPPGFTISTKVDFDKAAEDLRLATRHLGMIVGKVDVEEILGSIFNDFCIGK